MHDFGLALLFKDTLSKKKSATASSIICDFSCTIDNGVVAGNIRCQVKSGFTCVKCVIHILRRLFLRYLHQDNIRQLIEK